MTSLFLSPFFIVTVFSEDFYWKGFSKNNGKTMKKKPREKKRKEKKHSIFVMNKGDERGLYRKWATRIFVKMEWVYLCKDNLVATLHAQAKISYKDNWHELYYYKIIGLLTFLVIIPNVTEPRNFETFFFFYSICIKIYCRTNKVSNIHFKQSSQQFRRTDSA